MYSRFTGWWLVFTLALLFINTSHSPVVPHPPLVGGVVLCAIRMVGSAAISHVNTGKFLQLPLEWKKCDTSHIRSTPRDTPATTGNETEQDIQYSGWSTVNYTAFAGQRMKVIKYILESGQRKSRATCGNTCRHPVKM
jgi:hypothetical protein